MNFEFHRTASPNRTDFMTVLSRARTQPPLLALDKEEPTTAQLRNPVCSTSLPISFKCNIPCEEAHYFRIERDFRFIFFISSVLPHIHYHPHKITWSSSSLAAIYINYLSNSFVSPKRYALHQLSVRCLLFQREKALQFMLSTAFDWIRR